MGLLAFFAILVPTVLNIALALEAPTTSLNDGNKIPILALGTYGGNGDTMRQTINWAVEAGYRHIDTASLYGNEEDIGRGIADVIGKGLVKREDLFVTTKLWNDKHARNQVVPALKESLSRLGLSYVDLYLIHFPISSEADGSDGYIDYLETWQGMEDAKRQGLAKSIGVSNFNSAQIKRIIDSSQIPPAVNQIEIHPAHTREALVTKCHNMGVAVMAYSPFGFLVPRASSAAPPPQADDPALVKIAQKYGKTTNQIVLRYLIERSVIPVPKSTNKDRLKANIDVFDFTLTPEEVATISKFNVNKSVFGDDDSSKNHPYYPYTE
ncbi:aldo-keto reductase AKR2E4-like [Ostrinia furnacalis]|uniref:aldo-keto reductase AKR2E4-like n=1 Tax=Ostrinia furnacalis TaxID=93504 RepID=UPI00103F77A8|nr:aldo-keto reductase AKR2E4-like [Ostrinia furnacalis]